MRHRVCMHGAKHRRARFYIHTGVFEPRALHSRETSEQERETLRKRGGKGQRERERKCVQGGRETTMEKARKGRRLREVNGKENRRGAGGRKGAMHEKRKRKKTKKKRKTTTTTK